jgi:predicted transcriptional regulator
VRGKFNINEFAAHSTAALLYSWDMPQSRVEEEFDCAEEEAGYAEYERTGEALPIAAVEQWVRSWGTENELLPPMPCKPESERSPLKRLSASS